jgi:ferredoxin
MSHKPQTNTPNMADFTDKHPRNVSGAYYNDTSCVDCDLCREIAPHLFRRDADTAASYVWKQPATPAEVQLAEEALLCCPSETIGSDGA